MENIINFLLLKNNISLNIFILIVCIRMYILYVFHSSIIAARITLIPLSVSLISILKDALALDKDMLFFIYIFIVIFTMYTVKRIIDVMRGRRQPDKKISSNECNKRFIELLVIYVVTLIIVKLLDIE